MEKLIQEETNKYAKRFYEQIKEANYEILNNDRYINASTHVRVKCDKGHEFNAQGGNFNQGTRCRRCGGFESRRKASKESKKEFISLLIKENYTALNIDDYVDVNTRIKVKCDKGHEYKTKPSNYTAGSRCSKCVAKENGIKNRFTQKEFIDKVHEAKGEEYTVLGDYKGSTQKVKVKHNECGYAWDVNAGNFMFKTGCPNCSMAKVGLSARHTTKEYKSLVKELTGDEYSLVGEFVSYRDKVTMKHNNEDCNNEWTTYPGNFVNGGHRCNACSLSRGERVIKDWLIANEIEYKAQLTIDECRDKLPLPFDFGLYANGKLTTLIEYDGEQHTIAIPHFGGEDNLKRVQHRDNIKNEYAKDNNIDLLRIPYWDYDNIEEILKENILLQHT